MTVPRIVRFGPERVWASPGSDVEVTAEIEAGSEGEAITRVELLDVARRLDVRVTPLEPGAGRRRVAVSLRLPDVPRRGYGLRLVVTSPAGPSGPARVTSATSAIEALGGWWQSPRMAALTELAEAAETVERVRRLADLHVTVVQHYDWMWRHYRYVPPDGATEFTDALGRAVSLTAVRAGIEAGRERGMAALAYGAVYGAEVEHVDGHPADRVFDEAGAPLSLGGTFFLTDLRPGSAWRTRLMAEYARAIRDIGFDAVHMDTYGRPYAARGADGGRLDFAALYPGLVDEADGVVRAIEPAARVTFDCVDGFPLDAVAPSATAILYLELWPPDDGWVDVVGWIEHARALADGRHVVIAAYAAALREVASAVSRDPDSGSARAGSDAARAGAIESTLLLGSIIAAAGGYHHVLTDGDRLILEGYYPAAVPLVDGERDALRALWRFGARYVHLLSDADLEASAIDGLRIVDHAGSEVPTSGSPMPGRVWLLARTAPDGTRLVHLIDLREQDDDRWTVPARPSPTAGELRLEGSALTAPLAATPWRADGDARPLEPAGPAAPAVWRLPPFERWLLVIDPAHGALDPPDGPS